MFSNFNEFSATPNKANENFACGDIVKNTKRNAIPTQLPFYGHYGLYIFEWLREWNSELCSKVLVDGLITNKGRLVGLIKFCFKFVLSFIIL